MLGNKFLGFAVDSAGAVRLAHGRSGAAGRAEPAGNPSRASEARSPISSPLMSAPGSGTKPGHGRHLRSGRSDSAARGSVTLAGQHRVCPAAQNDYSAPVVALIQDRRNSSVTAGQVHRGPAAGQPGKPRTGGQLGGKTGGPSAPNRGCAD